MADDLNLLHGTITDGGGSRTFSNPSFANDDDSDTPASMASYVSAANETAYLVTDLGAAFEVAEHVVWGDHECGTTALDPDNGWSIQGSTNGSSWVDIAYTAGEQGSPGTTTYRVTFSFDDVETYRYWRFVYKQGVPAGFRCGAQITTWEIFGGEALPPPPPGPVVGVYSPTGTHIVDLTNLIEQTVRMEMDGTGSGQFVISKHDAQATAGNLARGNTVRVTYGEIDPDPIFEFLIEEGDFELVSSDEEGGENLTFGGPGTLGLLKRAVNEYREWDETLTPPPTGNIKPALGIWKWNNTAAGGVFGRMVHEAHLRGVLAQVTRTFSTERDTDGVLWPVTGSWQIPIGSTVYDEMAKLIASGWFHVEMRPGYFLDAKQSYGEDRTGTVFGTGVVRFVKGVNIADQLRRRAYGGEWASHVIAIGDGNYHTSNLGSYPYVAEKAIQVPSSEEDDLDAAADAALVTADDAQEAITFKHKLPAPGATPDDDAGLYYPGPPGSENGKYWLGDLVTVHTGSGDFEYTNVTHRVFAITLTLDETGALAEPIVELNAPAPDDYKQEGGLSQQQGGSFGVSSGVSGGTAHVHSQYQNLSEKGEASGYASLDVDALVPADQLGAGTPSVETVLRGDQTWRLDNLDATTDPAVTDDSGDGYSVGSRWVRPGTDSEWVATDVTVGAAVWVSTTDQGAGSGTITVEEDGGTPTVTDVDHIVFAASGDATVDVVDDTGGQVTVTIGATAGGGGSDPIFDTFGTPDTAFEFGTSSLTGLTAMGTPDTENADTTIPDHYYVADNDAVQVGRYASATPPFTAICKITEATLWDNYKYVGLFAGVATPGRFQGVYVQFNNTNLVNVKTFTSPSDGGPGTESVTTPPYEPGAAMPIYLAVKVNSSTNVDYYYSRSPGQVWYPIALARDPLATIASVGISVGAYAGTVQAAYDFLRIWNSALTFPAFS